MLEAVMAGPVRPSPGPWQAICHMMHGFDRCMRVMRGSCKTPGACMGSAPPPPRRNSGLCHVCISGKQHKAQKENGLVSGL